MPNNDRINQLAAKLDDIAVRCVSTTNSPELHSVKATLAEAAATLRIAAMPVAREQERLADAIDPLVRKAAPDNLTLACAAKALRSAALAQAPETMLNGLTEAETAATASCAGLSQPAQAEAEPVAWQERQTLGTGTWTRWYECPDRRLDEPHEKRLDGGFIYQWRPLYAAHPAHQAPELTDEASVWRDFERLRKISDLAQEAQMLLGAACSAWFDGGEEAGAERQHEAHAAIDALRDAAIAHQAHLPWYVKRLHEAECLLAERDAELAELRSQQGKEKV